MKKNTDLFVVVMLIVLAGVAMYTGTLIQQLITRNDLKHDPSGYVMYEYNVIHHELPIVDAKGTFIYTDTIPVDTIYYPANHPKLLKYIQLQKCIGDSATDIKCEECWIRVYGDNEMLFRYFFGSTTIEFISGPGK